MRQSPAALYRGLNDSGAVVCDPDQAAAMNALDELWLQLRARPRVPLWRRLRPSPPPPVKGIYLWGGVGRGKTWLMDLFFASLEGIPCRRAHFHRFMQGVHAGLRRREGARDPLPRIAADWSREFRVLCLDEFHVTDISDAMLLGGLLGELFRQGVTLVTTSNEEPDGLYRGGLQRAKFLPAIALLKRHTRVVHLQGETDFRLRLLEQSGLFHCPADGRAGELMARSFERMAAGCELPGLLEINDRPFNSLRCGDGIVWFDFAELCQQPRGAVDYIELARTFNTVLLSDVPQLGEDDSNAARRFMLLVDEFYDRGVKLVLSAAVPVDALYTGQRLAGEFRRTASRLTEMQSHDYLARPHLS